MRFYDIIDKKKNGEILSKEMINYFIRGVTGETIPDYQISALLMAICINGMDITETHELTMAMAYSGIINDLSDIGDNIVDKHSSGGVGDKCTMIIGPIVSSLGIPFAKLSGKGLGHTGGTIDKLDSIEGFETNLGYKDFVEQVREIGMAISAQTGNLAPADKKLYSIRDVTATVDSIPLIAASIMSKKIASGANNILLDVKCGSGAFMKSEQKAVELAKMMIDIGVKSKKNVTAFVTDMDQPLGNKVGNSLEIEEVCDALNGNGPSDLTRLCISLSAEMLRMAGYKPRVSFEADAENTIRNGNAYRKFKEVVMHQGGRFSEGIYPVFRNVADNRFDIIADESGFVTQIDAAAIGTAALELGAGRKTRDDVPDYPAGIILHKKCGDKISKGETLSTLVYNSSVEPDTAAKIAIDAYTIANVKPERKNIIIKTFKSRNI